MILPRAVCETNTARFAQLLSLVAIGHIASLYTPGGKLAPEYLGFAAILTMVPAVVLLMLKAREPRHAAADPKRAKVVQVLQQASQRLCGHLLRPGSRSYGIHL
jgi:hypothetical protein